MKQNNVKYIVSISLKLLVICSIVAAIVAFVNDITKERIALNEMMTTAQALTGIYSSDFDGHAFVVENEEYVVKDNDGNTVAKCLQVDSKYITVDDVTAVYVLNDADNNALGYCVSIQPMGFKDVIKMLVAVTPDLKIKGVEIVSMSETSGIGTKAKEPAFLEKFMGLGAEQAREVDIISGATKTTKPVISAVAASIDQVAKYISTSGGAN